MNTIDIHNTRAVRRLAAIAIVGALALSFAAIATLRAETDVTSGGGRDAQKRVTVGNAC